MNLWIQKTATWFNINNEGGVARTLAIKRTYLSKWNYVIHILTQNKGNLALL
jgi:hypothetical protein